MRSRQPANPKEDSQISGETRQSVSDSPLCLKNETENVAACQQGSSEVRRQGQKIRQGVHESIFGQQVRLSSEKWSAQRLACRSSQVSQCASPTPPLCRGSAELLEESGGNVSPAESMTSIPTCMPFSWIGHKDRDKDKERERDREPSSSSSSLPYTATETSSEQSQERRNKVSRMSSRTKREVKTNTF